MSETKPFIYLASQSPRRQQLLEQLGVGYALLLPDASEDAESLEAVLARETPLAYVARVTQRKLDAALTRRVRHGLGDAPVLCADTTVVLGREILGKPADDNDAARMLAVLAGKTHRVLTAVALGTEQRRVQAISESRVTLTDMDAAQIQSYVTTGEPVGKAGAYAVQGRAAAFIRKISGSYTGIMGLPLYETAQLMRNFGFEI